MTSDAIKPTKPFGAAGLRQNRVSHSIASRHFSNISQRQPAKEELQIGSVGFRLDQGVPSRISSGSCSEK